ncbi:MAG: YbgC/FadM family acyl-CoA thioesterase [Nitrospirae bacterium]|nr:YbgC/FadM family acyl-CoA thioesterase [Nitrospirota bacterium]
MTEDRIEVKVYYEDTDCGGVVYYANYFRYFERARTEYLEQRGVSLKGLMEKGICFVVVDASAHYRQSGRYGDVLTIETDIADRGPASITFSHQVTRRQTGDLLVSGLVKIASVSEQMKPIKLPESVRQVLG